jgi:AcrR family transcriptional regulator
MSDVNDRRKRRTKRLLAEALLALIQEKPYDSLTIQDITDRADVGRATFYMHYRDKEDLLSDALVQHYRAIAERLGMSRDDMQRAVPIRLLFEHVRQHAAMYHLLLSGLGQSRVYFVTRAVLAQYIATQLRFRRAQSDDVPIEWVTLHIAGAILTLLHGWLEAGMPHPPEQMERIAQRLIGEGVRAVLGIAPDERGIL